MPVKNRLLAAMVAFSLIPVYWIAFRAPAVGLFHDDGIYLVTAKALAEGKGYRIISLPDELPETKYPILFPALLAVLWKLFPRFPENALLLKTLPLLCTLVWCFLVYRFAREETGAADVGIWIALFTASSLWVVFLSTAVMSETLFACFCTVSLLWLRRLEAGGSIAEGKGIAIASICAAAAFLTRTAGLPLLAAGMLFLLFKRRYAGALKFALICGAIAAPWLWWQAAHSAVVGLSEAPYSWAGNKGLIILLNHTWQQMSSILGDNLIYLGISPAYLLGFKPGAVGVLIAFVFDGLALCGFVENLAQGITSLHLFLILYFGMLLAWAWPPPRFVVPVLPFLLLFAYKGLRLLCRQLSSDRRVLPVANLAAAIILLVGAAHALVLKAPEITRYGGLTPYYYDEDPIDWRELSTLMNWVREHAPPDAVLLSHDDPAFYLYTGRKALAGYVMDPIQLHYSGKLECSPAQIATFTSILVEHRVHYLVRTPQLVREEPFLDDWIRALQNKNAGTVRLLTTGSDPRYRIYEVDRAKLLATLPAPLGR